MSESSPAGDAHPGTPYYITTAIAYPNGDPHIGHAYEYIATDAIARFKRLDGFDVRFLTGTDVHGLKMAQTAAAEGIPTAELARRNSDVFQAMQEKLNISFDRFIRTSDADHVEASIEIWNRMNAAGDIYLDSYAGWYSVRDERFFTEDELEVQRRRVRVAIETGTPVTWTEEQTYFFRLSAYADGCWRTTRRTRSSSGPTCGATRSSASSPAACATCPSRAPRSTGACRCPTIPTTSCTCGSTR